MRWTRKSKQTPAARLLLAAGGNPGALKDEEEADRCRVAAFQAAGSSAALTATLEVAEEQLQEPESCDTALNFLENLQNLSSHGLKQFVSPEEIGAMLGPRASKCWADLAAFWAQVANWCDVNSVPLQTSAEMLEVENEQLRLLLWTSNRSLPSGLRVSVAHALRYESAGGAPTTDQR